MTKENNVQFSPKPPEPPEMFLNFDCLSDIILDLEE